MKTRMVRLQVSDWNYNDRQFDVPIEILREFKKRILESSMKEAWDWFVAQGIDYTPDHSEQHRPIKSFNCDFDVFLDYENPKETVEEWDPDIMEDD